MVGDVLSEEGLVVGVSLLPFLKAGEHLSQATCDVVAEMSFAGSPAARHHQFDYSADQVPHIYHVDEQAR